MNDQQSDGLVFSRAEFLVLMDAVKAPDLIGIDSDTLIPEVRSEHQALVHEGIERLQDRGLMEIREDLHVIHSDLLIMARIVSDPEFVTIVLVSEPDKGERQFNYYEVAPFTVEFTQPDPTHYRLASIPNQAFLLERIAFVLPIGQPPAAPLYQIQIARDDFFQVREWVASAREEKARALLRSQDVASNASDALLEAMANPEFSGTVALLQTGDQGISNAYNLAVLQGRHSSWLITPLDPEAQQFSVVTIGSGEFAAKLAEIRSGGAEQDDSTP